MRSISASSIASFGWQVVFAPRLAITALVITLLQCDLLVAQSTVPVQTPQQILAKPLQSIASAVSGEQIVRTKNGVGFRRVHVRPQDEVWLVSAREDKQPGLVVQRLIDGKWIAANMVALTQAHAMDQQKTSLVYVHGNRTDEVYARSRGLQFYENAFNDELGSGPIRFIIYAWRSEREKIRVGPDFRIKCDRSVTIGATFADFINQFEDRRLILSGFSLGGQVVLSGLAKLQSQAAYALQPKFGQYRVVLITPALKARDSLISVATLPTNPLAAETAVFINRKDIALLAAAVSAKVNHQMAAVTLEQLARQPNCGTTNSIVIEDMTGNVSRCHSISRYSAQSDRMQTVLNRMANELRGSTQTIAPQCEQCQMGSVVEVQEAVVESSSVEPAIN